MPNYSIELPPAEELKRIFHYDNSTGMVTRLHRDDIASKINKRCAGKPAGGVSKSGYVVISIGRVRYLAHRLIWKMAYGFDPPLIDHKNGNRSDNRIDNLRVATHEQNMRNRVRKVGKQLPKGVFAVREKFQAAVNVGGRKVLLGTFATVAEATRAYEQTASKLHSEFFRKDAA